MFYYKEITENRSQFIRTKVKTIRKYQPNWHSLKAFQWWRKHIMVDEVHSLNSLVATRRSSAASAVDCTDLRLYWLNCRHIVGDVGQLWLSAAHLANDVTAVMFSSLIVDHVTPTQTCSHLQLRDLKLKRNCYYYFRFFSFWRAWELTPSVFPLTFQILSPSSRLSMNSLLSCFFCVFDNALPLSFLLAFFFILLFVGLFTTILFSNTDCRQILKDPKKVRFIWFDHL